MTIIITDKNKKGRMPIQKHATSYVPPALRTNKPPPTLSAAPLGTKKTAPKKAFAIDNAAFPSLGETIKKSNLSGTPISFSSAAAKKIEPMKIMQADVEPGWVHIRQHAGKIEYKYGKTILPNAAEAERAEQITSQIILKNRIAREQYDRNRDIDRLGDLSEFYDQPSLAEMYENDTGAAVYLDDGNDSSDSNDSDHYS